MLCKNITEFQVAYNHTFTQLDKSLSENFYIKFGYLKSQINSFFVKQQISTNTKVHFDPHSHHVPSKKTQSIHGSSKSPFWKGSCTNSLGNFFLFSQSFHTSNKLRNWHAILLENQLCFVTTLPTDQHTDCFCLR